MGHARVGAVEARRETRAGAQVHRAVARLHQPDAGQRDAQILDEAAGHARQHRVELERARHLERHRGESRELALDGSARLRMLVRCCEGTR